MLQTIPLSEFKATCPEILEKIYSTGESFLVTKNGNPIALVSQPPAGPTERRTSFGSMRGTAEIHGDIVSPLPSDDWEALKD